jgi:hypothetical protein
LLLWFEHVYLLLLWPACMQGDPYKTLFVPRLSYEVTERKLKHEFEEFGPIKRIRLVHDRNAGETLLLSHTILVS